MVTTGFVFAFILALCLPTLLVVATGGWLASRHSVRESNRSLVKFYLLAYLLIAIPYLVISFQHRQESVGPQLLLVFPALDGLLALLVIRWRQVYEFWQAERKLSTLLLLALLGALLLAAYITPALVLVLLLPPLLAALVWALGSRLDEVWLVLLAAMFIAVLFLDALGIAGNHAVFSQDRLRLVYQVASGLAAILALCLAALFVHRAYRNTGSSSATQAHTNGSSRRWVYLVMAALLLLSVAAVTFRHGVLTNATGRAYEDHLPFADIVTCLVVGLVLAFTLPWGARRSSVVYFLVAIVLLMLAYSLGWQVDFEAVTAARADRLQQAISQYQQDTGQYPQMLADLTPGYLPVILGPLSGRGQAWCYQSGGDFYRLGYVFFQRYYDYPDDTPFWEPYYEIKVPHSGGQPPAGEWMCDEELRLYRSHKGL